MSYPNADAVPTTTSAPLIAEFPADIAIVRIAYGLAHVGLTFDVDRATGHLLLKEADIAIVRVAYGLDRVGLTFDIDPATGRLVIKEEADAPT